MTATIEPPVVRSKPIVNPYPGLRPFGVEESHLFFGREDETDALLRDLARLRFVSVLGPSGSGKSSLVRAGLIPAVLAGRSLEAGSDWLVVTMRPGGSPIHNLATALMADSAAPGSDEWSSGVAMIEATLRRSSLGLIDAAGMLLHTDRPVLLVVDQFEELFRFGKEPGGTDDAVAFVKLLVEAEGRTDHDLRIVLTMRSDFLGHCARFHGLPEIIDETLHLVPRLTRSQLQSAIEGPALVAQGSLSPRLVQRLLNDGGTNPDDTLPLLQHALQRSWNLWVDGGASGEIDLEHYERAGGVEHALSNHADLALRELDDRHQLVAERIFKRLVEVDPSGQEVRRPTSIDELAAVAEVSPDLVRTAIEPFARAGRSFLVVSGDHVVDVSHESFIRQWATLRRWVGEEDESRKAYVRLADAALRYEAGTAGLLQGRDLRNAGRWWEETQPNRAWASRYPGDFDLTADYLRKSRDRTRWLIIAIGVLALAVIASLAYSYIRTAQLSAERERQLEPLQLVSDNPNDVEILGLRVEDITDTTAVVSFDADQCVHARWVVHNPATIELGGGYNPDFDCRAEGHQLQLGKPPHTRGQLSPDQTYTVNVVGVLADGSQSAPQSIEFATLPAITTPPVIFDEDDFFGFAEIHDTWAKVQFRSDQCVGFRLSIDGVVHSQWGYGTRSDQCWPQHSGEVGRGDAGPLEPDTSYELTIEAIGHDGRSAVKTVTFQTAASEATDPDSPAGDTAPPTTLAPDESGLPSDDEALPVEESTTVPTTGATRTTVRPRATTAPTSSIPTSTLPPFPSTTPSTPTSATSTTTSATTTPSSSTAPPSSTGPPTTDTVPPLSTTTEPPTTQPPTTLASSTVPASTAPSTTVPTTAVGSSVTSSSDPPTTQP